MSMPLCIYCDKPLTENERDHETGTMYSAHAICTGPEKSGGFAVVKRGRLNHAELIAGPYTTARRALREEAYLRRFNGGDWSIQAVAVLQVSCGCCSIGCTCFVHRDIPNGLLPKQCNVHQKGNN